MALQDLYRQVMQLIQIMWLMLRYRVAVMLVIFMLIGVTYGQDSVSYSWKLLAAAAALAFSYICATSINDIADFDIDRVNHPNSQGRPLVNGQTTKRQLRVIFGLSGAIAIMSAYLVGPQAAGLMVLSVIINVLYSSPPFKLSHRTFLVPLVLAIAYVGIPYLLGVVTAGRHWTEGDIFMLGSLYFLFIARINLKDFRDRKGDAAFGKPTILLKFGKPATLIISGVSLAAGDVLLLPAVSPTIFLLLQPLLAIIIWMLWELSRESSAEGEQAFIGLGAKAGNSLLLVLWGCLLLESRGARVPLEFIFGLSLVAVTFANVQFLRAHPKEAINAYRG